MPGLPGSAVNFLAGAPDSMYYSVGAKSIDGAFYIPNSISQVSASEG